MLFKLQVRLASVLVIWGALVTSVERVIAQIVPDATLGTESSVVTPQAPGSNVDSIQGGATRGANLFHSFEQFSVLTGREAFFNNALDIQNVISRVTGASGSNIDGLIRANGTANLFLINPNGIIFGPNASLNIGGSFLGSTATSLNFGDGSQFSATAHPTTPLLTVSVPIGLQFAGTAGSIVNQSRATINDSNGQLVGGLQVLSGRSLALVGGDIRLDGGGLGAPGGRVELGGLAGAGTVGLNVDANNLRLSYPAGVQLANVSLANGANVDASGSGGGDIQVQGRFVTLTNGSQIVVETLGLEPGGTLAVTADEYVGLSGERSGLFTGSTGAGDAGDLTIATGLLSVQNGARVSAEAFGEGRGGNVYVNASDSVELIGTSADVFPSGLFANTQGTGDAGDLRIATGLLSVLDGAQISVSSQGLGNAGNLEVAAGSIRLENQAALTAETASGEGGNISLQVQDLLLLRSNSQISAAVGGTGNGGNISIDTKILFGLENPTITGNAIQGQGGNIQIKAQVVLLPGYNNIPLDIVAVPAELVDVTGLIATTCPAAGGNEFIITGRGGLPPSPNDPISGESVLTQWATLEPEVKNRSSAAPATNFTRVSSPTQTMEANGWEINNKGEIILTANASTFPSHSPVFCSRS